LKIGPGKLKVIEAKANVNAKQNEFEDQRADAYRL